MPRAPKNTFNWRPPFEGVDPISPVVALPCGGFESPGLARVAAAPHRSTQDARDLAERFARSPTDYLPLATHLGLPGVTDLRPTYGRLKVTSWYSRPPHASS